MDGYLEGPVRRRLLVVDSQNDDDDCSLSVYSQCARGIIVHLTNAAANAKHAKQYFYPPTLPEVRSYAHGWAWGSQER